MVQVIQREVLKEVRKTIVVFPFAISHSHVVNLLFFNVQCSPAGGG